jgi:hypothetical protein
MVFLFPLAMRPFVVRFSGAWLADLPFRGLAFAVHACYEGFFSG